MNCWQMICSSSFYDAKLLTSVALRSYNNKHNIDKCEILKTYSIYIILDGIDGLFLKADVCKVLCFPEFFYRLLQNDEISQMSSTLRGGKSTIKYTKLEIENYLRVKFSHLFSPISALFR